MSSSASFSKSSLASKAEPTTLYPSTHIGTPTSLPETAGRFLKSITHLRGGAPWRAPPYTLPHPPHTDISNPPMVPPPHLQDTLALHGVTDPTWHPTSTGSALPLNHFYTTHTRAEVTTTLAELRAAVKAHARRNHKWDRALGAAAHALNARRKMHFDRTALQGLLERLYIPEHPRFQQNVHAGGGAAGRGRLATMADADAWKAAETLWRHAQKENERIAEEARGVWLPVWEEEMGREVVETYDWLVTWVRMCDPAVWTREEREEEGGRWVQVEERVDEILKEREEELEAIVEECGRCADEMYEDLFLEDEDEEDEEEHDSEEEEEDRDQRAGGATAARTELFGQGTPAVFNLLHDLKAKSSSPLRKQCFPDEITSLQGFSRDVRPPTPPRPRGDRESLANPPTSAPTENEPTQNRPTTPTAKLHHSVTINVIAPTPSPPIIKGRASLASMEGGRALDKWLLTSGWETEDEDEDEEELDELEEDDEEDGQRVDDADDSEEEVEEVEAGIRARTRHYRDTDDESDEERNEFAEYYNRLHGEDDDDGQSGSEGGYMEISGDRRYSDDSNEVDEEFESVKGGIVKGGDEDSDASTEEPTLPSAPKAATTIKPSQPATTPSSAACDKRKLDEDKPQEPTASPSSLPSSSSSAPLVLRPSIFSLSPTEVAERVATTSTDSTSDKTAPKANSSPVASKKEKPHPDATPLPKHARHKRSPAISSTSAGPPIVAALSDKAKAPAPPLRRSPRWRVISQPDADRLARMLPSAPSSRGKSKGVATKNTYITAPFSEKDAEEVGQRIFNAASETGSLSHEMTRDPAFASLLGKMALGGFDDVRKTRLREGREMYLQREVDRLRASSWEGSSRGASRPESSKRKREEDSEEDAREVRGKKRSKSPESLKRKRGEDEEGDGLEKRSRKRSKSPEES